MYSEQDLKYAAEFRDGIHRDALARVRAVCPSADHVEDKYPVDAYFQQVWDYPGRWYTVVAVPPGAGSRKEHVCSIVRETLEYYMSAGAAFTDDAFYELIAACPDIGCRYRLVNAGDRSAAEAGVFPYRGVDSHRLALTCATSDGEELPFDIKGAKCRKLKGKALFAPVDSDKWLNYRRAFLNPPRGSACTDDDFDRVNAALFPGGEESLEVYRWIADGPDSSSVLLLTVYDKTPDRFVIIKAAASD